MSMSPPCFLEYRKRTPARRFVDRGFSLVELLVVISVIAIIAAIAIPNLISVSQNARFAKAQKNAQALAAMGASARAMGYTNNWDSVENAIAVLTANGGQGLTLPLAGENVQLGVSALTPDETAAVTVYLSIEETTPDILMYNGGVAPAE